MQIATAYTTTKKISYNRFNLCHKPQEQMPIEVQPTMEHPLPMHEHAHSVDTISDTLRVKANTAVLLKELDADIEVTPEDDAAAKELFKKVDGTDPSKPTKKQAKAIVQTPGIALALGGYITHYDQQVIHDKVTLRNIAINRLLEMSQDEDQKIAIKAVELIGKASDLFTEHQEITITHKNSTELQEALREKIRLLMQMNTIDVTPKAEKLTSSLDNSITDIDDPA